MTWDDLSLRQKSEVIGIHVRHGVSDLGSIRDSYNSFQDGGFVRRSPSLLGRARRRANEAIYTSIRPTGYPDEQIKSGEIFKGVNRMRNPGHLKNLWDQTIEMAATNSGSDEQFNSSVQRLKDITSGGMGKGHHKTPLDEDAWRKYLGIDQIADSFVESEYRPTKANDPNAKYYTLGNRYSREQMRRSALDVFNKNQRVDGEAHGHLGLTALAEGRVTLSPDSTYLGVIDRNDYAPNKLTESLKKVSRGLIDLNKIEEKLFNPFEIYDRVYIDKDHLRNAGQVKPAQTYKGYIVDPNRDYKQEWSDYDKRAKEDFYLRNILLPE